MRQLTWLITGASSGFGRYLTEMLLARGDRVAATSRNITTLADLTPKFSDNVWISALDVSDTAAVRRVVAAAFTDLGRIDVVVNNAGSGLVGAAEEFSNEQITRLINTNLIGSIQVIRAALPFLRAQGGGRIIQMSSMAGQIALPVRSVYAATKWGIEGFVESVMPELVPFGIQITLVEPGSTQTNFDRNAEHSHPLADYDQTVVGEKRRAQVASDDPGDPAKMAQAIIDSVHTEKAPHRLVLGSDAYQLIHHALTTRIAELEAQKGLAYSTDAC